MFISLLAVTFAVSLAVSFTIAKVFSGSVNKILVRIINEDIAGAWVRYINFAIIVVGVSSGVRVGMLERYILPGGYMDAPPPPVLNTDRWILEVYRTIIESASGVAWMLLVFFVTALIAYVLVKAIELKHQRREESKAE